jgi:two-component system, OmpR family, response regulator CpxR
MAIIKLFSGSHCLKKEVVRNIIETTGYQELTDRDVVQASARLTHMSETKLFRAFSSRTSVFNKFTQEKETAVAHLKLALSNLLDKSEFIVSGYSGLLLPRKISHAIGVCLIADLKSRISNAVELESLSEKEAQKQIRRSDGDCAAWTTLLFDIDDPWNPSLYDMVIPMDKKTPEEAANRIIQNAAQDVVRMTSASNQAVIDFRLAAEVEVALSREGHHCGVEADNGDITLTINRPVLVLNRLQEELKSIVEKVPGVSAVNTVVGKSFHQSSIYRKHDFKLPSKVLLVDDEREFIETLSERLQIREMGAAVAFDATSAMKVVAQDEPDVMIIDLKMPGIDGMEMLQRIKQTRPNIEVIVLTGHGSRDDQEQCMAMGAFAYLQKPVDIDELGDILKKAHANVKRHGD